MATWQTKRTVLVLGLWLAACAHEGDPMVLQFRGNLVAARDGDTCRGTNLTQVVTAGVFDVALASHYVIHPALQSMLQPTPSIAGTNPNLKDTNIINLTELRVSVVSGYAKSTPFGTPSPIKTIKSALPASSWTVPMTGVIPSGEIFYGEVDLIPAAVGADWAARFAKTTASAGKYSQIEVLLQAQFAATTLTGDNVITEPVQFPVKVCFGCSLRPINAVSAAPLAASDVWKDCYKGDPLTDLSSSCYLGQDGGYSCAYYCAKCTQEYLLNKVDYVKCDQTFCPVPK